MNKSLIFLSLTIFSLQAMEPESIGAKRKREEINWSELFDTTIGPVLQKQMNEEREHPELIENQPALTPDLIEHHRACVTGAEFGVSICGPIFRLRLSISPHNFDLLQEKVADYIQIMV